MRLHVEVAGDGPPVVLLHGLTASHRYVVMGSRRLERSGHRVLTYDARAHGASDPADDDVYDYAALADDLVRVLGEHEVHRAVLVGASMGAHTAIRVALEHPALVAGLVVVTPAHEPGRETDPASLERWDRLAAGLERGGADGFVEAFDFSGIPEGWRDTVRKITHQRLSVHEHPRALAQAVRGVPRSAPFGGYDDLARVDVPVTVVGDHDDADPGHPLAVARAYAEAFPDARLVVEDEGKSPIAWQGGQLSGVIAEHVERTDLVG
ncbi:alpha/beta fold hydrolase [Patulibacter sp. SYSU D01012]|uniref:alpha/beta fold hydrolase n=1 Tax=Patulibacter sp. SYSU D01012 TaxID=2817381 RepID=UPI001B30917B|nr:alpha/beta fold hydrolase [Patulibacter sp. SYSU D01012]